MDPERAREILAGVIGNPEVRERVILLKVFQKHTAFAAKESGRFSRQILNFSILR